MTEAGVGAEGLTSKTLRRALLGERGMFEEVRLLSTISSIGQLPSLPKAVFLPTKSMIYLIQ